jgi:hypothetical protein
MPVLAQKPLVGREAAMVIDEYDVTGQNMEYKSKRDAAVIDATVFGERFSYDLAGIQKASIEYKGFYGPGDSGYNQAINRKFGQDSDVLLGVAPQGWGILNDFTMQPSVITKYDIDTKLKGAVDVDINAMARGAVDDGYLLFAPTVFLTTGSTINSNVLDQSLTTGATAAGCAAQLHVITMTAATTLAVAIQGSPDGSTWTTLTNMTFSTFSVQGKQRLTLGVGNAVPQMIRGQATVTGTGGVASVALGWARNVVYA